MCQNAVVEKHHLEGNDLERFPQVSRKAHLSDTVDGSRKSPYTLRFSSESPYLICNFHPGDDW